MPALASLGHIRAERNRYRRAIKGQSWSVKDLPKFYYHKNFSEILRSVTAELSHLLKVEDKAFISNFDHLPFEAQCSFVRMCGRKGTIFHISRFVYKEIPELWRQFEVLSDAGFVCGVGPESFKRYLESLTKLQLTALLETHLSPKCFKKSWKKDKLFNIAVDEIEFLDTKIEEDVWVQKQTNIVDYILYLHSGQIENGLQNQTLRDLGLVNAGKSKSLFGHCFDDLEAAKAGWFFARELHQSKRNSEPTSPNLIKNIESWPAPRCSQSLANKDKLVHKIGRALESRNQIDLALQVYSHSDSSLCNERTIRLRYKRGEKVWVKSRLESLIENPASDDEYTFVTDFYARKYKKKRTSVVTDILRQSEKLQLDEAFKHEPEQAAIRYFQTQGMNAFWTENRLWRNLFGLLFWDEIYPKNPKSKNHPGLESDKFYVTHMADIETKLAKLKSPEITLINLLKTYTLNYGRGGNIIRWRPGMMQHIEALIQQAPPSALGQILREMANNWNETKDGFPDLMITANNACKFVEIKAAGDVIRRNQLTRLKQLRSAGFDAHILQIEWAIDPKQTYVVVDVETTGGRPGLHRVTEIGAVKVKGGKIIDEWSSLINPQRSIPSNITRLTGITNAMVASAPVFSEIVDSFETFVGNAIFAAHNVNFDYGFINAEFQMVDRKFRHPKICTCSSMRKLYPGHASYSLKNLCQDFDIDLKNHHRALSDAKAAAELLFLINERRLQIQNQNEGFAAAPTV